MIQIAESLSKAHPQMTAFSSNEEQEIACNRTFSQNLPLNLTTSEAHQCILVFYNVFFKCIDLDALQRKSIPIVGQDKIMGTLYQNFV